MKNWIKYLLTLSVLIPAAVFAIGNAGYMLDFQTSQIAIVPDNALLDNLGAEYTLEAWINVPSVAGAQWQFLLERADVFAWYIDQTTGMLQFRRRGPETTIAMTTAITPGWHHVAVRRQNVGGTYTTAQFLDGVQNGGTSTSNDFDLSSGGATAMSIGNSLYTGYVYALPLLGTMDELRIWTVARSNTDLQTYRGVPLAGSTANLLAYYKMDEGSGQVINDATANNLDAQSGSDGVNADVNDPSWVISTAPIGFNLFTPNGGTLNAGTVTPVTWAVNPALATVDILISFDGVYFYTWAAGLANTGTANLTVPAYPTTLARVRVANPGNPAEFDVSDANITISMVGFVESNTTIEAESGVRSSNHMYVRDDGEAFNSQYIFSTDNFVPTVYSELTFNVPVAGMYVVWARVMGPGGNRNSWRVSMDGGPIMDFHVASAGFYWKWDRVSHGTSITNPVVDPLFFNLTAGPHKIRFIDREHYTCLDRIFVTNNLNPNYYLPEPIKWIRFTDPTDEMYAPNDVKMYRNTPYEIKWKTSSTFASTVTIEFNRDEGLGEPWVMVVQGTPNDGSYIWTVPDLLAENARLRISEGNGTTCPRDWTLESFPILNPPPQIIVNAPNGGEVFEAGTTQNITWTNKYYSSTVSLSYSLDDGAAWTLITGGLTNTGTYAWAIPADIASTLCLVRVADTATGTPMDVSDAVFTIEAPPPPPLPDVITVSEPNGGENWKVGSVHAITWTVEDGFTGLVNIFFSSDNGVNWTPLITDVDATGVYEWTIPNVVSAQCLIKVAESTTSTPFDVSDALFSIVPADEPLPAPDYALQFDGNNDLVTVPSAPSLNVSSQFTIEFWMKTDEPDQKWRRILEKGSWDEYYIAFYGTTGRMCGALRTAIPGGSRMNNILGPSTSLMAANAWIHVAATFDGAAAKLYINGTLESTKAGTASPRSLINDLIIGGARHVDAYEYHYKGVLDEMRLWNVARNEAQIVAGMFVELDGTEAGLAAYYSFDEGAGQVAGDKSANANHGVLGKLNTDEDCDPLWVLSDRPTSVSGMATLQYAMLPAEEETELAEIPEEFELLQNYPNPFNATTTIVYNVPNASTDNINVTLQIYDLQGRLIRTLFNGASQAGSHQATWDGYNDEGRMTASGIYFYRLQAGNFVESKRMIMLK